MYNNGTGAAPSDKLKDRTEPRVPLLRLEDISKSFSGVRVLSDISLDIFPEEVHVLFGENGAGKSTLINIIAGAFSPDHGRVFLEENEIKHFVPTEARSAGISPVFQEFSLVPDMTVEENIFLG